MAKESIVLPDIPADWVQLEDYVAALFQAAGHFVQRGILYHDPRPVLELDAVATDYRSEPPTSVLAEVKSGGWGYNDIFKVAGWMRYLDITRGGFFITHVPDGKALPSVQRHAGRLDIIVAHMVPPDFKAAYLAAGFPAPASDACLEVWRFIYAMERGMLDCLKGASRAGRLAGARAAWQYYELINHKIFFETDDFDRVSALYEAFTDHPKLSLGLANELSGKAYDPEHADPDCDHFRKAIYEGHHDVVQACLYVEHRARLAVLKAVVDLIVHHPAPKEVVLLKGLPVMTQADMLPGSVKGGIAELRKHPAVRHYAQFWQVFLWGFGGFYLRDREADEFRWLSEETGVPVEEIPNALRAFDILFPWPAGWWSEAKNSQLRLLKLVPFPLQGLGVYSRRLRYGVKTIEDLGYKDWTSGDLGKRYMAGYNTLKDLSNLPVEAEAVQTEPGA